MFFYRLHSLDLLHPLYFCSLQTQTRKFINEVVGVQMKFLVFELPAKLCLFTLWTWEQFLLQNFLFWHRQTWSRSQIWPKSSWISFSPSHGSAVMVPQLITFREVYFWPSCWWEKLWKHFFKKGLKRRRWREAKEKKDRKNFSLGNNSNLFSLLLLF